MFTLLTLAAQVLANAHKLTDADSWRNALKEFVLLIRTRVMNTQTGLDDAPLKEIEFVLNNDDLFRHVYRTIAEQFQTEEILFESVDEDIVTLLVEDAATKNPEVIDPVVILSLITQIVSMINAIKVRRNR